MFQAKTKFTCIGKGYLIFLLYSCAGFVLKAQVVAIPDTIEYAREQAFKGNLAEASAVLTLFNTGRNNAEGLRLHAQVLYWQQQPKKAIAMYEHALRVFPHNQEIKSDFGTMLFELGKLNRSFDMLSAYAEYDSLHIKTQYMLAMIDHWWGRESSARKRISFILNKNHEHEEAKALLHEIQQFSATHISTGMHYQADDQPMQTQLYRLKGNLYRSWLWAPSLLLDHRQFQHETGITHTLWIQGSNRFYLGRIRLGVDLNGGMFVPEETGLSTPTWNISLQQRLFAALTLKAENGRTPYQYTMPSINRPKPVMHQNIKMSLALDHKQRWLGETAWLFNNFEGMGNVYNAYAWALAPVFHRDAFRFKLGYSFSFADSDSSTYQPQRTPLGSIITTAEGKIAGNYDPYFSPQHQYIHAVLVSSAWKVTPWLEWDSRFSFGSGQADNPYFYEDLNASGELVLKRGFTRLNFSPMEFESKMQFRITSRILLSAQYTYNNLFFYTMHRGVILFKYHFIKNEKR